MTGPSYSEEAREIKQLVRAANSQLIEDQEICIDLDDPLLACVSNHRWKTGYYPVKQLAQGILDWRPGRKLIQHALHFLKREDREFLMTGFIPADWDQMFRPKDVSQEGDTPF